MNAILLESSHSLVARFFDASVRELALVPIYSNDFYSNTELLHDFKNSPFYLTSNENVITLKSTFYMPQSIYSGKEIYFLQLGLFNFTVNHSLYSILQFANHIVDSYHSPLQKILTRTPTSQPVPPPPSTVHDLDVHIAVDGVDCNVFNINVDPKEKDCDESFCFFHALFNSLALTIQKKESLITSGSLLGCTIEMGSEDDDSCALLSQLAESSTYDMVNNKLFEFEINNNSICVKINQVHIMINPFSLLRSANAILNVVDKLPLSNLLKSSPSSPSESTPSSHQLCYSLDLIQPLIELVVNEKELVCLDCFELRFDYNPIFFYDISMVTNQLELYSVYLDSQFRVDYCSDLSGSFSMTFNDNPLYGIIRIELDKLMVHCYPKLFSLVNSLQTMLTDVMSPYSIFLLFVGQASILSTHTILTSHSSSPKVSNKKTIPPFERIELQISSFLFTVYDLNSNIISLGMDGFQSAFTVTDYLSGSLVLNELSLIINNHDSILVSHNHNSNSLLHITIENQVITSSLSSLSVIIPSTLSETIFNLLSTYKPYIALLSSPTSSEPKKSSTSNASSHFMQILHRIHVRTFL